MKTLAFVMFTGLAVYLFSKSIAFEKTLKVETPDTEEMLAQIDEIGE